MLMQKKNMIRTAAKLYTLGIEVEKARTELKRLVECDTPYESAVMVEAYQNFKQLNDAWTSLEIEYQKYIDDGSQ